MLPGSAADVEIAVLQTAGSTNDVAKKLAAGGAKNGALVVADTQTEGRGRYARAFYSPSGAGLYMSAVLRPGIGFREAPLVTIAAAVAVCRSVKKLTGFSPSIKWINDIFLNGKKVGGILTEAAAYPQSGPVSPDAAAYPHNGLASPDLALNPQSGGVIAGMVAGIGINVSVRDEDFPEELRRTAGSLYPDGNPKIAREALAASIFAELLALCEPRPLRERLFLDEYRSLSFVLGRHVCYTRGAESGAGLAAGIDGDGRLLVRSASGDIAALDSGEVSITL